MQHFKCVTSLAQRDATLRGAQLTSYLVQKYISIAAGNIQIMEVNKLFSVYLDGLLVPRQYFKGRCRDEYYNNNHK
jgi:hypothetical protein